MPPGPVRRLLPPPLPLPAPVPAPDFGESEADGFALGAGIDAGDAAGDAGVALGSTALAVLPALPPWVAPLSACWRASLVGPLRTSATRPSARTRRSAAPPAAIRVLCERHAPRST